MRVRRETGGDVEAITEVTIAAFIKHLCCVQEEIGFIRKKQGYIYLEASRSNFKEYMRIMDRLEDTVGVSRTAMECRLRQLNLLDEHRRESAVPVGAFLRLDVLS